MKNHHLGEYIVELVSNLLCDIRAANFDVNPGMEKICPGAEGLDAFCATARRDGDNFAVKVGLLRMGKIGGDDFKAGGDAGKSPENLPSSWWQMGTLFSKRKRMFETSHFFTEPSLWEEG